MSFDLRFTDKEITAWGGMAIMKRMLDHLGFDPRFSIRIIQGVKTGLNVTGILKDFDL